VQLTEKSMGAQGNGVWREDVPVHTGVRSGRGQRHRQFFEFSSEKCIFYRAMLAQSAVMRLHVVCPSVCNIYYRVKIGLKSLKIISRPNSLRPLLWLTPNMGDLVQREHPQN